MFDTEGTAGAKPERLKKKSKMSFKRSPVRLEHRAQERQCRKRDRKTVQDKVEEVMVDDTGPCKSSQDV